MNLTLPLLICPFVDLSDSRSECSPSQPDICIQCPILGKFMGGGGLDDFGSPGHVITLLLWILTVIVGGCGTLSNSLIILIMKRQNSSRAFDFLLIALACFDLLGSATSVIAASTTVIVFENLSHGVINLYLIYLSTITCFFARSASTFMTVLITLERYLVIRFPINSVTWFTSSKTKCLIGIVFLVASSIAIPRYASFTIVPNHLPRDITSLANFDYLIVATAVEQLWFGTLRNLFNLLDFWFPLPLLLILNALLYVEIRKFARRRRQMSIKQRKDMRAIKMFAPVVVVLFLCYIEPYVYLYYIKVEQIVAREHLIGVCLSIAVNSAANLPIYYFKGGSLRSEVRALFKLRPSINHSCPSEGRMETGTSASEENTALSGVIISSSSGIAGDDLELSVRRVTP